MPPQQQAAPSQTWEITDPRTGVTIEMTGANPPTEKDIAAAFDQVDPQIGGSGYAADAGMRHSQLAQSKRQLTEGARDIAIGMAAGPVARQAGRLGGQLLMRAGANRLPTFTKIVKEIPEEASKIFTPYGQPARAAGTRTVTEIATAPPRSAERSLPVDVLRAMLDMGRGRPLSAAAGLIQELPIPGTRLVQAGSALKEQAGRIGQSARAAVMAALLGGE